MPSQLQHRRERAFRPTQYTAKHREVVRLAALGFRRYELARWFRYSPSHISRILHMPEAVHESIQIQNHLDQISADWLIAQAFKK